MKTGYVLKMLLLWLVIFFPVQAGAEDLGALRLSQMEGDVQIQSKDMVEWNPAVINLPLRSGDRLWVPQNAWAQVETREGSVVRLDAETSLEVLAVEEGLLHLYLGQGQAYLKFKEEADGMIQVDSPVSSIRMYDSSTLNVAVDEQGNCEIAVFRGAVYAENRSGEVRVAAGKMLSMDDGFPTLMALGPPGDWEKWNRAWDDSLIDAEDSEQYLPPELTVYGRDLSRNGRWIQTREYGYVWTPTTAVSVDWAPYRHGRWVWIGDDYVWIAQEPWGWAPYHYGRWSYISSHGWCWIPPPRNEVYWGPGYVSWVLTANTVAWVPLAPTEIYYGYGHYGPHSINILNIDIYTVVPGRNYRNVHVPDAVTVVHRNTFLRGQHRNLGRKENPFLQERIHVGRPRIEPERTTRMPIVRDIPREHQPPVHLRSTQGRAVSGERRIVRERDRSVFRPTVAPQPLTPAIRMSPEAARQGEVRRTDEAGGRQRIREQRLALEQGRSERPASNRDDVLRDSVPSAPAPQLAPAAAPPVPEMEQPALRVEQEQRPAQRDRQQEVREQMLALEQGKSERPASNRGDVLRDSVPSAPVPQLVPAAAPPVAEMEQPALRVEQEQRPARRDRQQEVREQRLALEQGRRERPVSNRDDVLRDSVPSAPAPQLAPAAAPAVPEMEQPALRVEQEQRPAQRDRQQEVREQMLALEQERSERPASNRDDVLRDSVPSAPAPQFAPAAAPPVAEMEQPALRVEQEQRPAQRDRQQEVREQMLALEQGRRERPASNRGDVLRESVPSAPAPQLVPAAASPVAEMEQPALRVAQEQRPAQRDRQQEVRGQMLALEQGRRERPASNRGDVLRDSVPSAPAPQLAPPSLAPAQPVLDDTEALLRLQQQAADTEAEKEDAGDKTEGSL